jgi:hypothetical protein
MNIEDMVNHDMERVERGLRYTSFIFWPTENKSDIYKNLFNSWFDFHSFMVAYMVYLLVCLRIELSVIYKDYVQVSFSNV